MRVIIYSIIKDFPKIKTTCTNHVITHLCLKDEKPVEIFRSNK